MPWRPAHETHAIERVNLTFMFAEAVPTKVWQPLVDSAANRFQDAGFRSAPSAVGPSLQIVIGGGPPAGGPPVSFPPSAASEFRTFVLADGTQPLEEASLARTQITFGVTKYNQWSELLKKFRSMCGPLLSSVLEVTHLSFVKLEYWDRFTFFDKNVGGNYTDLFAKSSPYVPNFVYQHFGAFHSHSGFFLEETPFKRLINVNIDSVDLMLPNDEEQRLRPSVGIYTLAQDMMADQAEAYETLEQAISQLDQMHTILKQLFGSVITEEMQRRISLFERGS